MKLLSYLSLNPEWKKLVSQLVDEKKIDLNSKDEKGRNLVLQACTLDVDVNLIKYLVEEKNIALERDVNGKNCLDIACDIYLDTLSMQVHK